MTTTTDSRADLLIQRADQVSGAWLSAVLGTPVTLTGVERVGTGQMSQTHRVSYRSEDGTERTVVLKVAAEDERSRATGVGMRAYWREVRFYAALADRLRGPLPDCHLAEYDEAGGWFTLVLSDVAAGRVGDQIAGCGLADARTALRALARVQAPVTDDPTVAACDVLSVPSPITQSLLEALLPGFLERYGDRVAPEHAEVLTRFVRVADAWFADHRPPQSIVHGDFRLDNLLFDGDGCTVVDWQTVSWGSALHDVAYLIGGGLDPAVRRAHERELVEAYADDLRALGVAGVDDETCWQEYRRQCFHGLVLAVVAAMVVARTDRGDEMFMTWLDRNCRQVLDLDALSLLPAPAPTPQALRPDPVDEGHHAPGPEQSWNESWYFDAVDGSGELGVYVRLGRLPNQGTSMYMASIVRAGQPSVVLVDPRAPLPPLTDERQALATDDVRAEQECLEPLQAFRVSMSGLAPLYEDPSAPLRGEPGTPVEVAIDLRWDTDGVPYAWRSMSRYEIPCRVTGTVRVGDQTYRLAGPGQRDHSWGARDWWAQDWMWSAFHLADGTHTHAVTTPVLPGHAVGYVQRAGEVVEVTGGTATHELTPDGLVASAQVACSPPELALSVEPVAFGALPLVAPDGRVTHFPRALARVRAADGRTGVGWIEWNLNQPR